MKSTNNMWIHTLVVACILSATAGTATAATISYVGVDYDIEDHANTPTTGWRNTTPVKPLDIDGDNILGTDGYYVYHNRMSNPSYATLPYVAPNRTGRAALFDDPSNPSGADVASGMYYQNGIALGTMTPPLLQFVISGSDLDGKTLRVGVLVDMALAGTATYTVAQTTGGVASATSPILTIGGGFDVVYFDIDNAVAGDAYVIKATTISGQTLSQVAGMTFDTAVAGILLSKDNVSSNAAPGTLVGSLSYDGADDFDVVVTGAGPDSGDFQVSASTNLRTKVWMDAASKDISIVAYSNSAAILTNNFTITVSAVADEINFVVSAEVQSGSSDGTLVGTAQADISGATFAIVAGHGRDDLFYFDGADLKLTNASDWGGVGTTNYVMLQSSVGTATNKLVVAASVVTTATSGTVFRFR